MLPAGEEVCPEQAIFLKKEYSITGYTRKEMVNNKEKLLEMGGVMEGLVIVERKKIALSGGPATLS